ncbi:MAG TPA: four helix bundle protein [bacterium]|jgi:four helix bundle protein
MNKDIQSLRDRTRGFAHRIIRLYMALPQSDPAHVLGKQILRSGTSVGAQYREACRAKSNADFISKLEGALQELDETAYWLELLSDVKLIEPDRLKPLMDEADQLTAIIVTMTKRVKQKESA